MRTDGIGVRLVAAIALFVGGRAFGQQAARPVIRLWAVPGELRIDPITGRAHNPHVRARDWRERSSVWSKAESTVSLAAARNETLGFQLIIEAEGENLKYVRVKVSDLTGPGGAKVRGRDVALFRVWYTEVTEPSRMLQPFNALGVPSLGTGWYGDALIPFHLRGWGRDFAVPKGRNQAVWVDLKVPKGVAAGEYRGVLRVEADRAEAAEARVRLEVWDFAVPDRLSARAEAPLYRWTIPRAFGVKEHDDRHLALERQYFRMCRAHRFIGYVYDTWPELQGDGLDVRIDWTRHDRRFGGYLDGTAFDDRLPIEHYNVPVETRWPSPAGWARTKPELYYGRLQRVLKLYDEHFRRKRWSPRMYVFFQGLDEPSTAEKFAKILKLAEAVHRASDRIRFRHDFYTAFADGQRVIETFDGAVDIWCISSCFYPVRLLAERQRRGEEAWFYQGAEPWVGAENLDNEALGLRTWAWIAWKYRVDCWHNWCAGRWHDSENIFLWPQNGRTRQAWRPNSNGVMIYPGAPFGVDELFGSIRLKAFRRGNTDYEYMVMLKKLGAGKRADEIVNSVVRRALGEAGGDRKRIGTFGDWSHDPDEWAAARRKLAAAILQAARRRNPPPSEASKQTRQFDIPADAR